MIKCCGSELLLSCFLLRKTSARKHLQDTQKQQYQKTSFKKLNVNHQKRLKMFELPVTLRYLCIRLQKLPYQTRERTLI